MIVYKVADSGVNVNTESVICCLNCGWCLESVICC